MNTVADVRLQMRLLGYNGIILSRGEVKELPKLLRDNEYIEQALYGSYPSGFGMLVATNQRLLFIDKRFFHSHFIDIPYDAISSVELDTNLFTGQITVYTRIGEVTLRGMSSARARKFFDYLDKRIESRY